MVNKAKCPACTNERLLDIINAKGAEVQIKCKRCGKIINLNLAHNQIKATVVK
ncbi:MAG: hypothetical protein ACRC7N_04480 [Clostridium sp.]